MCLLAILLTALLAQVEIPLPYIPISGQTLAVGLVVTVLGSRLGTIALAGYVIAGILGAPVFTDFGSGLAVLTGSSGGYIFGFVAAAFVIGFVLEKTGITVKNALLANLLGTAVILLFGLVGLRISTHMDWSKVLTVGLYPFILSGILKAVLAGWGGVFIRRKL